MAFRTRAMPASTSCRERISTLQVGCARDEAWCPYKAMVRPARWRTPIALNLDKSQSPCGASAALSPALHARDECAQFADDAAPEREHADDEYQAGDEAAGFAEGVEPVDAGGFRKQLA